MRASFLVLFMTIYMAGTFHAMAMTRIDTLPEDFRSIRDPLLPTDYTAPVARTEQEREQERERERLARLAARITWPRLRIQGITHAGGQNFIAIIDQVGIVEAGETITLREGHLIYAWRVDSITEAGITTTRIHVTSVQNPNQPMRIWEASPPATSSP